MLKREWFIDDIIYSAVVTKSVSNKTSVIVDGLEYHRWNEVPAKDFLKVKIIGIARLFTEGNTYGMYEYENAVRYNVEVLDIYNNDSGYYTIGEVLEWEIQPETEFKTFEEAKAAIDAAIETN